jgi:hypothetical protein
MEVGPFRTIPAAQTQSGKVELKLVEGGWEEFATIVFGEFGLSIDKDRRGVLNALFRRRVQWTSRQGPDSPRCQPIIICMSSHR